VRDALKGFREGLSDEVRKSPIWAALLPMLAAFGDPDPDNPRQPRR